MKTRDIFRGLIEVGCWFTGEGFLQLLGTWWYSFIMFHLAHRQIHGCLDQC